MNNEEINKYTSSLLRIDIHEVEDVIRHQLKNVNRVAASTPAISIEISSLGTFTARPFVIRKRIEKLSFFENMYEKEEQTDGIIKRTNGAVSERQWLEKKLNRINELESHTGSMEK